MTRWDSLWRNVHLATMAEAGGYGEVRAGAIGVLDGRIAWLGPEAELPGTPPELADEVLDGEGGWLTPGLIDAHTHLLFGGVRAGEFEMRLEGASYEDIARRGGGILSTVRDTRGTSERELLELGRRRTAEALALGVTTLEIKSGYGLDVQTELRLLRVARRLGEEGPLTVRATFLAAHALPEEFEGRRDDYLRLVCEEMLPPAVAEGLVDSVDAFCERIAFGPEECARVFDAAWAAGLPVRLHADQLSDGGGAALAARYGALSADHLEYCSPEGVRALAEAGTVAGLLPGAFYFLRQTRPPPVEALREAAVPMMIGTDWNPGSSPLRSLPLAMNLGCTLFGLTPLEALEGVTRNAARALGLEHRIGTLERGKAADLALWSVERPAELSYWIGGNPCVAVVKEGRVVRARPGSR